MQKNNQASRAIVKTDGDKLKEFLNGNKIMELLRDCIHKDFRAEGVIKSFCIEASKRPEIYQCSNESKMRALLDAAQMGLPLSGPQGHAYLIPRSVKGVKTCCYQVGYLGYVELLYRNKVIKSFDYGAVYPEDDFVYVKGSNPEFSHDPNYEVERNDKEIICFYAVFYLENGMIVPHVMTRQEVMKRREVATTKNVWDSWFVEMAIKTVIRAATKKLRMTPDMAAAIGFDDQSVDLNVSKYADLSQEEAPKHLRLDDKMSEGDASGHQGHETYTKPKEAPVHQENTEAPQQEANSNGVGF